MSAKINKFLKNRQRFIIGSWVRPELSKKWKELIAEYEISKRELEKEIRANLEQRIEVRNAIDFKFEGESFSCIIEIRGDLWKV